MVGIFHPKIKNSTQILYIGNRAESENFSFSSVECINISEKNYSLRLRKDDIDI